MIKGVLPRWSCPVAAHFCRQLEVQSKRIEARTLEPATTAVREEASVETTTPEVAAVDRRY